MSATPPGASGDLLDHDTPDTYARLRLRRLTAHRASSGMSSGCLTLEKRGGCEALRGQRAVATARRTPGV